jgi:hypothetical protein
MWRVHARLRRKTGTDLKRMKPQIATPSQELKGPAFQVVAIAAIFLICVLVLAFWHPWRAKNIHGVPTEVAPTTAATQR